VNRTPFGKSDLPSADVLGGGNRTLRTLPAVRQATTARPNRARASQATHLAQFAAWSCGGNGGQNTRPTSPNNCGVQLLAAAVRKAYQHTSSGSRE